MSGFSDYLEDKVLDHVFGGNAFTAPSTLYVPLIDLRVDLRFSEEFFSESFDISFEYE